MKFPSRKEAEAVLAEIDEEKRQAKEAERLRKQAEREAAKEQERREKLNKKYDAMLSMSANKTISTVIPAELYNRLSETARECGMTVCAYLRLLIETQIGGIDYGTEENAGGSD